MGATLKSTRKVLMYTTLALFIFIGVIMVYLVVTDQYDDTTMLWNLDSLQLITTNVSKQYKSPPHIPNLQENLQIDETPPIETSQNDKYNTTTTQQAQPITSKPPQVPTNENETILANPSNPANNTKATQYISSLPQPIESNPKPENQTNQPHITQPQSTQLHQNQSASLNTTKNPNPIDIQATIPPKTTLITVPSPNDHFPPSWEEMNDQQFCSIQNDTRHKYLMQVMYNQQFTRSCNISENKFLIYDVVLEKTRGLGASVFGYLCRYMTVALQLNRTFLLHGQFDWTLDVKYCENTNAMECYFLPLSTCDPVDILSQVTNESDITQFHQGSNPTDCRFGANDIYNNLTECESKIILINKRKTPKPMLQKAISDFAQEHFRMKIFEFEAILVAFFLRPQPNIRRIVYDKIQKSINKSLNGDVDNLNPSEYISMPIRASDKCRNIGNITHKHYTHKAETSCFVPVEYMLIMNVLKTYSEQMLKGVILTSEDSEFVQEVIDFMRNDNRSLVKDWNVILNTEDYSVGEGTTTYKQTKRRYHEKDYDEIGTSFYTDHIVSALSSLMLQLHLETEYLVWLYESSWTELMWNWLAILNCNINKERHKVNYNKCCKLLTSGYIHHRDHNKIELPKEMWFAARKRDNLTAEKFHDKYGIWYSDKGYCHIAGSKNRVAKR